VEDAGSRTEYAAAFRRLGLRSFDERFSLDEDNEVYVQLRLSKASASMPSFSYSYIEPH
jgi:hypothetical protein